MAGQANLTDKQAKPPAKAQKRRPGRPTLSNEELLDKALDLFLERGFEGTSIEAICSTAGMAKRTVYARYGDKTTLFKAAISRAIEEWIVPVARLREAETGNFEEDLLTIGRILVTNLMSPAGLRLLRLTNAVSGSMPEIGAYNVDIGTGPTLGYLADLFRRHCSSASEGFPEADDAAQAFLYLVVGGPTNAAAWGVPMDAEQVERDTRYNVRLFLHGLQMPGKGGGEAKRESQQTEKLLSGMLAQLDKLRDEVEQLRGLTGN